MHVIRHIKDSQRFDNLLLICLKLLLTSYTFFSTHIRCKVFLSSAQFLLEKILNNIYVHICMDSFLLLLLLLLLFMFPLSDRHISVRSVVRYIYANFYQNPFLFFSVWVFFHTHRRFTGQQGELRGHFIPLYHFHPLKNIQTCI